MNLNTLIIALRKATDAACAGDPESENMLEAIISDLERESANPSPIKKNEEMAKRDELAAFWAGVIGIFMLMVGLYIGSSW
jgi:hypothetical protein